MPRVAFVWNGCYPWDVRIEKMVRSLQTAGHEVTILCDLAPGRQREETLQGLRILRHRGAAPFHPGFRKFVVGSLRDRPPDLIIVRDIKVAPAVLFPSRAPVPIILDMAENYPAAVEMWGKDRPIHWLTRSKRLVRCLERYVLPRVDHILVVAEESRARLIAAGVSAERLAIVGNTPPRSMAPVSINEERFRGPFTMERPLRLAYVGGVMRCRLRIAFDGMAACRREQLPVFLDIVGGGQVTGCDGLESIVRFHGQKPYKEAMAFLNSAHVGIITNDVCEHTQTTIPNKLFEYMMFGLPSLTTPMRPVVRILNETKAGKHMADESGQAFCNVVRSYLSASGDLLGAGRAGRKAFETRYHWERDEQLFLEQIDQALHRQRTL